MESREERHARIAFFSCFNERAWVQVRPENKPTSKENALKERGVKGYYFKKFQFVWVRCRFCFKFSFTN